MSLSLARLVSPPFPPYITGNSAGEESVCVVDLRPASDGQDRDRHAERFRHDFLLTLRNPDHEGLLTSHLFFDANDSPGHSGPTCAWDAYVKEFAKSSKNRRHSNFWKDDKLVITHALSSGLLQALPERIKFISYGPGELCAFQNKEMPIVSAFASSPSHRVVAFCAVDILRRYAIQAALDINSQFNIASQGVVGDFLFNGRLAISTTSDAVPVVFMFGGPFENTPVFGSPEHAQDATAVAWAKMNQQHGLGSLVVKTFDADQDPQSQLARYAATPSFEAFVLGAFVRATQQGIITTPGYDVAANWHMVRAYDPTIKAVKLIAECRRSHTIDLPDGPLSLRGPEGGEAPDLRTFILSHKWDRGTHTALAERGGYEVLEFYQAPDSRNQLMVAKAVRTPDRDVLNLINQQPS